MTMLGQTTKSIIASEENNFKQFQEIQFEWKFNKSRQTSSSNYYKSNGFYDVKISSNLAKVIDLERAEWIYSIDEGKRYTIGKISTNLDEVFDKNFYTFK